MTAPEPENDALSLREKRRLQRIQLNQEQVLDAAEQLFGNQGYQGTSLEQVAAASEFSVGAVYTFFKSKRDLLSAVMNRRSAEQGELIRACLTDDRSGQDQLLCIASASMAFYHKYPAYGRLTMRVYATGLEVLPDFADYTESYHSGMKLFASAIARGQEEGTIRDGDPIWLARMVSALIVAHHSMVIEDVADSDGFPTEDLLDLIRGAVSVPAARNRSATAAPKTAARR
ncbi:TetR/AcrR family transcriptional regulator [Jatrophihabitans sp. DSM 45814]